MYCFYCAKWQGTNNHTAKSLDRLILFTFALLLFTCAGCSRENEDILNQQKSGQTDNCSGRPTIAPKVLSFWVMKPSILTV